MVKIEINKDYYVKITFNDRTRLYTLKDTKEDKTLVSSYNRDSFLLKCRQYTKISNLKECVIASY